MKKNTKERILEAALAAFNERGYANVRLADIALHANNMSVGNLVYHFPNKQDMLLAISRQIKNAQEGLLDEIQLSPLFENFEVFLLHTFRLQQSCLFFYIDMVELIRASEALQQWMQEHIRWKEIQLELILQLNEARGALDWSTTGIAAGDIVRQLRRTMDTWHVMNRVEGGDPNEYPRYRESIWQVLRPFFTEMGKKEYAELSWEVQHLKTVTEPSK